MKNIPIGVQLYSVREDCAKDLPGTLKSVAEMGYTGVEFAGYHGRSAKELKQMLDDLGLKCCGTHTGLDTLLGDNLQATIDFNQILNNPYLIVPWIPEERRDSKESWLKTADLFSEIAAQLKPLGMYTGYHNHAVDFQSIEGQSGFDIFFSHAEPGVIMQIDLGNALHGGADPIEYLRRYTDRATTVHLKEFSASNPQALIGEGDIAWGEVFEICEKTDATDWYIVEQESYAYPPLECIDLCLQNLKKMGK